ncbi:alpha-amylase family glycosyl hydrolase [Yinghuangia aomiensis]
MASRAGRLHHAQPMSVYEVHLGSWKPGLSYRELAAELPWYVRDMGFTHVEFMPVAEHPFGGSWGYQVTSYYAPTSRFGSPDEFRMLVDALHQAGIGVIVDWVPRALPEGRPWAHSPGSTGRRQHEHPDPRRGAGTPTSGARWSSTTAATRSGTSWWRTRYSGAKEVPHRRHPRADAVALDAVPRLLARGRRLGAERARRAGENWTPCGCSRR